MELIHNIYCVGRNYGLHAAELGNDIPEEPMIFIKPTHALVPIHGQTIELPGDRGEVHFEAELVLHVGSNYKPGMKVDHLIDTMSLGIDFTLRDVQSVIKKKGQPWLPAKGFLNSAALTVFRPFNGYEAIRNTEFALNINGKEAQRGNINDMIFDLQVIVDYIGKHYGLGKGDIIYTGTPAGVGAVHAGDKFELIWGTETVGEFTTALS
ncbi:fumarylacetoacetate hydrolase family protein [Paenibacillus agricola]|uniref:Fumarylacetoacetate hydrolase family protein n=1 Tax=Paenibacillus agricola TaxID=2716264 RepID=A0ABX0J6A1_9BACL|nr:fumarylacetoacetate hydrolase family protein [Paenibacillus agricola]NHN31296.1 fumarylacetoacetate hydrolase family protein [Paenibacillus agricola]